MLENEYLIVIRESATKLVNTSITNENGEEMQIHFDTAKPIVLGVYTAESEKDAIKQTSKKYNIDKNLLQAFELRKNISPLTEAIMEEIDFIVEEYHEEWEDKYDIIKRNLEDIAYDITDSFDNFTDEVHELLQIKLDYGEYE